LKLIGCDVVLGFIDVENWSREDKKEMFVASPMIEASTLNADEYYILDVRTQHEWDTRHIPGAHHLELNQALKNLDTIPLDKPVAVICHSGNRASIVASSLMNKKVGDIFNVRGGMQAWKQ